MASITTRSSVTKLVPLLERLALLRVNAAALDRVIRCVEFANTIHEVDIPPATKPMISATESECIHMRDDTAQSCNRVATVKNATQLVEDYFVTPAKHKHYSNL